jgi:hypothetical protein
VRFNSRISSLTRISLSFLIFFSLGDTLTSMPQGSGVRAQPRARRLRTWGATAPSSSVPLRALLSLDSVVVLLKFHDLCPVRSAYQPPASITFLSEQISHQQPANSTFLSEQTNTSHQPPAKRTGCWLQAAGIRGFCPCCCVCGCVVGVGWVLGCREFFGNIGCWELGVALAVFFLVGF